MRLSFFSLFVIVFFGSCASFQFVPEKPTLEIQGGRNFYLIGDAGKLDENKDLPVLKALIEKSKNQSSDKKDYLIFLGDNVYPNGIELGKNKATSEVILTKQIDYAKMFNGNVLFIPGNHDWYHGLKGLKRQEKMVEEALGKSAFEPDNGCPLKKIEVVDEVVIIVVDSEWYITDWNKHPTINDECDEIKTRSKFWEEFAGLINKNQNKQIILAVHHPLFTQGTHDGNFSFSQYGLPIINIPLNLLRHTSGVSPADLQFPLYSEFANRVATILQDYDDVVVVSGHDHNLQFIRKHGIEQIISGSGSKVNPVKNTKEFDFFGCPNQGYAILNIQDSGEKSVKFFDVNNQEIGFRKVSEEAFKQTTKDLTQNYPETKKASIYPFEPKSDDEKFLNKRYRKYYYQDIEAPVALLDTLYGELKVVKKGGGNQSISLRLKDKEGKQYVLRRLRKSAKRFIQVKAFREKYLGNSLDGSFPEKFLLDIYTTAYPFASFLVGDLADAANVNHTNPKIFYLPKQSALGKYNDELGNDLYMIEERPEKNWVNSGVFGNAENIISTDDVLNNLRNDEKYQIHLEQYIRTRLFDMWLGDWDRHEDQYRWGEKKVRNGVFYYPIPRDRDQAFPKFDGTFLQASTRLIAPLRLMQSFDNDIRNVVNFNQIIYRLDLPLTQSTNLEQWLKEAEFLETQLTDEVIENAFKNVPKEAQDELITELQNKLKKRKNHIKKWAQEYYNHLNKNVVVQGTDKDDIFLIQRLPDGKTRIKINRNKKGKAGDLLLDKTYDKEITKEIWVYGLDDDDKFIVKGKGRNPIKIRIIGGQNNDIYSIENGRKIVIYDHKDKPNTFETKKGKKPLTNDYHTNVYDHKKFKNSTNQLLPTIGYNPDAGLVLGMNNTFTHYGFVRNPFTSRHQLNAQYFTAVNGFQLNYQGEFAKVLGTLNFGFDALYTTDNYAQNFFGFGNETSFTNNRDIDFYRVRLNQFHLAPSLIWRGRTGGYFQFRVPYESLDAERTEGRITDTNLLGNEQTESQSVIGAEVLYLYENLDHKSLPTLGMNFDFRAGVKRNLDLTGNFAYLNPSMEIYYPILPSGNLVLNTLLSANVLFGNDYLFYQAATIGGINGLRGFRNQRFTGEQSFFQNTDIRLGIGRINTGLIPLKLSVFGGFDYGRVWIDDEDSSRWHTSVGAGMVFTGLDILSLKTSYFVSEDGGRFVLGFNFGI